MKHSLAGWLTVSLTLVLTTGPAFGQDKVERRDRKSDKPTLVTGRIVDESMAGIKIRVSGKEELIPASDILRLYPEDLGALKLNYDTLYNNESKERDLAKVLKEFTDFKTKMSNMSDIKPSFKRYIDFRIAELQASLADTDNEKQEARVVLNTFVMTHSNTWEYAQAAPHLARMLVEAGDYEKAGKLYDALARNPSASAEIKRDSEAGLLDTLFQANKLAEAKAKLTEALKNAGLSEQQKARYGIYQMGIDALSDDSKFDEQMKKLNEIVEKNADNSLRALACNVMGDCYAQKGRKGEAVWQYLWVDVVYSQDKNERFKAMVKLAKYYQDENDTFKAEMYREKLKRLR